MKRLTARSIRLGRRGFSLLEVMVAVAILGLALSVILSAQGGLAASNKAAANMGTASAFARCKMTEVEEKLLKLGYPELDDVQTDIDCCDDKTDPRFTCDTKVEKVILPNPPDNTVGDGGSILALSGGDAGLGGLGNAATQALGGPGGNAALSLGTGDGGLFSDGGLAGLGSALDQSMGPGGQGTQGMLSMVLGIVYPSLKLLMEASIRRVTVTVRWHEGPSAKDLALVQYLTNPQRFQAGVADGGTPTAAGSTGLPSSAAPATGGLGGALGTGVSR